MSRDQTCNESTYGTSDHFTDWSHGTPDWSIPNEAENSSRFSDSSDFCIHEGASRDFRIDYQV